MSKVELREHPKYKNIYMAGPMDNLKIYTKNLTPGYAVYGEKLIQYKGSEFREWDPYRSKLAAIFLENPITNFISDNVNCLYLGASTGTTISHLSDLLTGGIIYGVEFSERSIRQLIQNTSNRKNIIPLLGDARFPESYAKSIFTEIHLIYQDVAQPNQAEIAVMNSEYYLEENGIIIIAIKSQSIDSTSKSEKVYEQEQKKLENSGYKILETINIHRFAANHMVLIVQKKTS